MQARGQLLQRAVQPEQIHRLREPRPVFHPARTGRAAPHRVGPLRARRVRAAVHGGGGGRGRGRRVGRRRGRRERVVVLGTRSRCRAYVRSGCDIRGFKTVNVARDTRARPRPSLLRAFDGLDGVHAHLEELLREILLHAVLDHLPAQPVLEQVHEVLVRPRQRAVLRVQHEPVLRVVLLDEDQPVCAQPGGAPIEEGHEVVIRQVPDAPLDPHRVVPLGRWLEPL
mmetsp:Transcript_308/g.1284  ORF Transcript_308/g.1284 Transcript_308/m.1284 type:complete len:226 (-) Transcript_308:496-1173(-)